MKTTKTALGLGLLALGLAAPGGAQTSFTTYVAVGDSLTAGVVSGSLVVTHQRKSFPALIAGQAGVTDFQQPLVGEPGAPAELALTTLLPNPIIAPKATTPGAPTNLTLPRPYNNLAVPGATSVDALTRVTDGGGAHDLVLRNLGTQVQQAAALKPTVVTLWIGNNDVLGAAVRGRAIDGVTLTPAPVFRETYGRIVAALKASGATIVAANLPDVTSIPFVTTIPSVLVNPSTREPILDSAGRPIPLIGPNGPIAQGSLVTLGASGLLAQGIGVPTSAGGRGTPLPDDVILDPGELGAIRDRVIANNQAIADICGAAAVPVLDANALLRSFASGRTVAGITLNSAFLTGGLFGYDGVHPSEIGYALLANEWIKVINANGGKLPEVDLGPFLGASAARAGGAPSVGQAGWAGAGTLRAPALAFGNRVEPTRSGAFEFSLEAWATLLAQFPTLDRP